MDPQASCRAAFGQHFDRVCLSQMVRAPSEARPELDPRQQLAAQAHDLAVEHSWDSPFSFSVRVQFCSERPASRVQTLAVRLSLSQLAAYR